ncbi:MAG: hypothetical protein KAR21_26185, partial [Spirochaetales bacterium]|nr:hypothetical protein [Spirochaetales bacterium]
METEFNTSFGIYELKRDSEEDKTLRAWDSSDTYALDAFKSEFEALNEKDNLNITIFNDSFGALT